jgi:hypothetical protein
MMGDRRTFSRRSDLRAGLGAASAAGLGAAAGMGLGARPVRAAAPRLRGPGAVPYPSLPLGQYTGTLPFDHLVLVMQENAGAGLHRPRRFLTCAGRSPDTRSSSARWRLTRRTSSHLPWTWRVRYVTLVSGKPWA